VTDVYKLPLVYIEERVIPAENCSSERNEEPTRTACNRTQAIKTFNKKGVLTEFSSQNYNQQGNYRRIQTKNFIEFD